MKKNKWIVWTILLILIFVFIMIGSQKKEDVSYETVTAVVEDMTTYYSFSGNIEANDKESIILTTTTQIQTLNVSEGDLVKKGDVLFTTIQGNEFKAGIDGEIATIYVTEGEVVTPGTIAVDITDYTNLQVKVKVDEYDIKSIEVGKEATVIVNALDKEINGTVSHVSKEAQSLNGVSYFLATIDLNEDSELRVGMSTEVKLVNESVKEAIVIPMNAIQFDYKNSPYVYYCDDKGEVMTKAIEVGVTDGVVIEIKSGIESGEEILTPKTLEFTTPFEMMKKSK